MNDDPEGEAKIEFTNRLLELTNGQSTAVVSPVMIRVLAALISMATKHDNPEDRKKIEDELVAVACKYGAARLR